ncbi:MAG TPA: TIGR00282 family metallophosphoesterase [Candidatus Limnocylindrales bacterium]|nr:TIGR00282 family metallophosphoesterase [Candidatus Limnocylindrales bacterium]
MNILYVGDIMGEAGVLTLQKLLSAIKKEYAVDVVIAQAENVSQGKGITLDDFKRLRALGVDFCTGGNHSLHQTEIVQAMNDPAQPIIRPANYPKSTPGLGYKYAHTSKGRILVISLLGHVVGRDADKPVDNPLQIVDAILEQEQDVPKVATIVNFHGDFSSEKVVIGRYLDGRVTLVVGDHWHVPTADAQVLPGSTAHITDVGMCGSLDSSLGVKFDTIMTRWRTGVSSRNELETDGRMQLNAVVVDIDEANGRARSISQVRQIVEKITQG